MAANTCDAVSAGHTEGGWRREGPDMFGDFNIIVRGETLAIGAVVSNMRPSEEVEANARLIVAACNSYDRHFGSRAIEAAEADLLGKALEALDKIHGWLVCHSIASADDMAQMFPEMTAVAKSILSQAREVK